LEYTENPSAERDSVTSISFGIDRNHKVIIYHTPFHVELLVNDVPVIIFNNRGFFNFEHLRKKETGELIIQHDIEEIQTEKEKEEKQEEGLWEETFNGNKDSKPNGNLSIYQICIGIL
jgi:alpha 1,3-glucosidase